LPAIVWAGGRIAISSPLSGGLVTVALLGQGRSTFNV